MREFNYAGGGTRAACCTWSGVRLLACIRSEEADPPASSSGRVDRLGIDGNARLPAAVALCG